MCERKRWNIIINYFIGLNLDCTQRRIVTTSTFQGIHNSSSHIASSSSSYPNIESASSFIHPNTELASSSQTAIYIYMAASALPDRNTEAYWLEDKTDDDGNPVCPPAPMRFDFGSDEAWEDAKKQRKKLWDKMRKRMHAEEKKAARKKSRLMKKRVFNSVDEWMKYMEEELRPTLQKEAGPDAMVGWGREPHIDKFVSAEVHEAVRKIWKEKDREYRRNYYHSDRASVSRERQLANQKDRWENDPEFRESHRRLQARNESTYKIFLYRAKQNNIPCTITEEQLAEIQSQPCAICGVKGPNNVNRIDSTQGYFIDNCRSACAECNRASTNLTDAELVSHVRCVLIHQSRIEGDIDATRIMFPRNQLVADYASYQRGAEERQLVWGLSYIEFMELANAGQCAYCGYKHPCLGIDRVDNADGYNKNNCVACCKSCNYMKSRSTRQKFIDLCVRIHEFNCK